MRLLDEGRAVSPEEFVAGIPDESLRESVLRRLVLFGRIYRTVREEANVPRGALPDIPGYAVEREVGRGGSGSVYRAKDVATGQPVAIKLVPLPGVDPHLVRRFAREYRIVCELRHRGIVRIHATGDLPAAIYFVLEWIEGSSLAEILEGLRGFDPAKIARLPARVVLDRVRFGAHGAEKPPDPARGGTGADRPRTFMDWIIGSFTTLADGLAEIHAHGIVHRDISPSNVMIRASDASPVLLDFGLARQEGSPRVTATGDLIGKPHYVPPECARQLRIGSSPGGDIYSLGAVLYETLALRRPFDGHDTGEILRRVLKEDPPLLRSRNREVSSELQALVLWMLEKNPRRRAPSARVVADDLARIARGERTLAAGTRPLRTARRAAKRLRPALAAAALVAAAAAVFQLGGIPGVRSGKTTPGAPAVVPAPRFSVADVRSDSAGIRVSSLTLPIELFVPVRAPAAREGGGGAAEPVVAVAELDGDESDEIVLVEGGERPSDWDLVAFDLDAEKGPKRLYSLRAENSALVERLRDEGYRPGRVECADVDADGDTDVLFLLHAAEPARSLVLAIGDGGRVAGQLSLPARIGASPRSFFVEDWPPSPNPWLVIAGRDAAGGAEPFVLMLDPSSFAGSSIEARPGVLPARGSGWIVPVAAFGDAPPDADAEAALLRVDDRCVVRLTLGLASVSFDASGPSAAFECDRTDGEARAAAPAAVAVIHGRDGPARPSAPSIPAATIITAGAIPSPPRAPGSSRGWHATAHDFGIALRDESERAVFALRFDSRFSPATRLRAVARGVPAGGAVESGLFVAGVSFPSHPTSNCVVGMRPDGTVLGPSAIPSRAPFEPDRRPNDAGLDPQEIVALGSVGFPERGVPTLWLLVASRTRGGLVFLDERLSPVSTVWAPGPPLDSLVQERGGGGRLAALFRYAASREPLPSDEILCALVSLTATPTDAVLPYPRGAGESAARDRRFPVALFLFKWFEGSLGAGPNERPRLEARGDRLGFRTAGGASAEFDENLRTPPGALPAEVVLVDPEDLRASVAGPPLVAWRATR